MAVLSFMHEPLLTMTDNQPEQGKTPKLLSSEHHELHHGDLMGVGLATATVHILCTTILVEEVKWISLTLTLFKFAWAESLRIPTLGSMLHETLPVWKCKHLSLLSSLSA